MNAARGAEAAAKSLGWEATIVDGKNDPQTTNAAVQRAVAQKATGIIVVSSPQSMYSEGLAAAKKAGIPVVTTTAGNKVGADGVDYDLSDPKEVAAAGSLAADYVISQSDGKANVVVLNDTSFTLLQPFQESLLKRLGECSGCKVEQVVEFTGADVTTRLAGLVSTALERHPDTNWVISPYGAIAIFASNAIRQSGRDVKIISYASDAANNDLIRKDDVQVAAIDKALGYGGWRAVDTLVRLQGGEQMGTYEEPHKLLDKSNLPPAGQPWDGDEDYQAMFKQLWGGQ
jgi:ribose transport system substrate-binding protein